MEAGSACPSRPIGMPLSLMYHPGQAKHGAQTRHACVAQKYYA